MALVDLSDKVKFHPTWKKKTRGTATSAAYDPTRKLGLAAGLPDEVAAAIARIAYQKAGSLYDKRVG